MEFNKSNKKSGKITLSDACTNIKHNQKILAFKAFYDN